MSGMKGKQFLEKDIYLSPFNNRGTILWVCSTPEKAKHKWHQMGDPSSIFMTSPGSALGGRRFEQIILEDPYGQLSKSMSEKESITLKRMIDAWLGQLTTKISPTGCIQSLEIE